MNNYNVGWVQQGWQCPICKTVYSPMTHMCYTCVGRHKTTSSLLYAIEELSSVWDELDEDIKSEIAKKIMELK